MEKNQLPDFLEILKVLTKHKVDFIVVGGVCAVLHGAPITTFDLDLVHSRSSQNLSSLMSALNELDAFYRGRVDQQLKPKRSHLLSSGHQLLMTNAGPLDLLGTIGSGHTYKNLLKHTVELEAGGLHLRMLNLEKLIEIKKETITDKDRAMILILQHILEERQRE